MEHGRRAAEAPREAVVAMLAHVRVFDHLKPTAGRKVAVVKEGLRVMDRRRGQTGFLQEGHEVLRAKCCCPLPAQSLDLVNVARTALESRELVGQELRDTSKRSAQAPFVIVSDREGEPPFLVGRRE